MPSGITPSKTRRLLPSIFPADYICEAIDQTRGWFYSLHAIAALVSDSVAYRNCICLSHIVDEDGKKMSKSLGNIVNPYDVFDHIGADPLRWYFLARLAPESQKRISVDIVREVASSFVNTLWNTYAFFTLYASLDNIDLDDEIALTDRPEIDRWALALTHNIDGNPLLALWREPGKKIPAQRIRADMIKDIVRIDDVAKRLGHFFAVFVDDMTQADTVAVGHTVRDQRGDGVQAVEPAAGLVDSLTDVVSGKMLGKSLLVFEGVMPLGIRHCARVEPAVDDFGDTPIASAVFRMGEFDLIDRGAMQISFTQRGTAK